MFSLKSNFNKIYICNQGLENDVTKIWKTYFYIMKKKSIEDWKGDYKFHQRGFIHLMFAVSRSWTFVILLRHDLRIYTGHFYGLRFSDWKSMRAHTYSIQRRSFFSAAVAKVNRFHIVLSIWKQDFVHFGFNLQTTRVGDNIVSKISSTKLKLVFLNLVKPSLFNVDKQQTYGTYNFKQIIWPQ